MSYPPIQSRRGQYLRYGRGPFEATTLGQWTTSSEAAFALSMSIAGARAALGQPVDDLRALA